MKMMLLPVAAVLAVSAMAQDDPVGWSDAAEFSLVVTSGNSETSTVGFKNILARARDGSTITLKTGGIRASSTTTTRTAIGTGPASFTVSEKSDSGLTAENYFLNGRYDQKISKRFFWYAGAGWERNRFAGIEDRFSGVGGVGNTWFNGETVKFKTDYALTYTDQEDVIVDPQIDDRFAGARFSWTYWLKFTGNATYGNDLKVDQNLSRTSDFRADMTNSVSVSMNKRLALKLSLQWLYDNEPALEEIPLFDMDPGLPGATQLGTVRVERDTLDSVFNASLVVNF